MKIMGSIVMAVALLLGVATTVQAEDYPTKPITIVVPYPPGGTADFFARIVGGRLGQRLGQPVVVEAKPGAGGNIGSDYVAKSDPDGYTLLLGTSGSNAVNPSLYARMPYDARKDLTMVASVATTVNVMVVAADSKAKSVKDIIAKAKSNPEAVTYGSSGNGSVLHLSSVMLSNKTGTKMIHVPYKGTPPALLDVMAGRVDYMIANAPSVVSDVKAGKLRALAVTTSDRMEALPDVPTMQEAGIEGYDLASWFAVLAPAKTPADIITKLNGEIREIIQEPGVVEKFSKVGASPKILDAPASKKFFLSELDKWGALVKASGARVGRPAPASGSRGRGGSDPPRPPGA